MADSKSLLSFIACPVRPSATETLRDKGHERERRDTARAVAGPDCDVRRCGPKEAGTVPEDVLDRVEVSLQRLWLSYDPMSGYPHCDRWPMVVGLSERVWVEWSWQANPTSADGARLRGYRSDRHNHRRSCRVDPLHVNPSRSSRLMIRPRVSVHSCMT